MSDAEKKIFNLQKQLAELEAALVLVDSFWFDPKDESGACGSCDCNLHPNCMGKHQQLNGDPCPFQTAHDSLITLSKRKA